MIRILGVSSLCVLMTACAGPVVPAVPTTQMITQAPPLPVKPVLRHIQFGMADSSRPYCLSGADLDILHTDLLKIFQYQSELGSVVQFYSNTIGSSANK